MYLVFDLPKAGVNTYPSAHVVAYWLHSELEKWGRHHQTEYRTKYHKNTLRLIMPSERDYNFFMLSWNPDMYLAGHRLEDKWSRFRAIYTPKH